MGRWCISYPCSDEALRFSLGTQCRGMRSHRVEASSPSRRRAVLGVSYCTRLAECSSVPDSSASLCRCLGRWGSVEPRVRRDSSAAEVAVVAQAIVKEAGVLSSTSPQRHFRGWGSGGIWHTTPSLRHLEHWLARLHLTLEFLQCTHCIQRTWGCGRVLTCRGRARARERTPPGPAAHRCQVRFAH